MKLGAGTEEVTSPNLPRCMRGLQLVNGRSADINSENLYARLPLDSRVEERAVPNREVRNNP